MNFIPFQKYLDSSLNLDLDPIAGLADLLEETDIFPYSQIPNFPMSVSKLYILVPIYLFKFFQKFILIVLFFQTVPGHKSRMLFGLLDNIPLMLMQGRFHAYEGYPLEKVRIL